MAPDAVEKVPGMQSTQTALTCIPLPVEYVPATQFWHVRGELLPVAAENFPEAHGMQPRLPDPVNMLYVPASHGMQLDDWLDPGMVEYNPGLQLMHARKEVMPGTSE